MPINVYVLTGVIVAYFTVLFVISQLTGKNATNENFFSGGHRSAWWVVAFGMIGGSISGVTFISVPGAVGAGGVNAQYAYMQLIAGNFVGYLLIAQVLLPLYYRLRLVSIYSYLGTRFGRAGYLSGSAFFILSRSIGAAFRLYLVAVTLHYFVFEPLGVGFAPLVLVALLLTALFTFRGGIRTIVWTDTVQTFCLLAALTLTLVYLSRSLELSPIEWLPAIQAGGLGQLFFWEGGWADPNHFLKQFLGGVFIAIAMTGLDQDLMQKNLSCRSLRDAQRNMYAYSIALVVVNLIFVTLGALLWLYAEQLQLPAPAKADFLFPTIALTQLPIIVGIAFIIGITASAYGSIDSAITALTTAFCIDFLGFKEDGEQRKAVRYAAHIGFSLLLLGLTLLFRAINNESVINSLFRIAGFTYGPLLGMFAFGLASRRKVLPIAVPFICCLSPLLTWFLSVNSAAWFGGYKFGFELLLFNAGLTATGLWAFSGSGAANSPQLPTN